MKLWALKKVSDKLCHHYTVYIPLWSRMRYLAIIAAIALSLLVVACIPVTIRPQFDEAGLPKATPVTIIGSQDETGTFHPAFPVSSEAPTPPDEIPWGVIGQIGLGLLGLGGVGVATRSVTLLAKAKAAIKIACDLADNQAVTSDPELIRMNKLVAQERQREAGVLELTQTVRGKKKV